MVRRRALLRLRLRLPMTGPVPRGSGAASFFDARAGDV